jgi:hypothetical protein
MDSSIGTISMDARALANQITLTVYIKQYAQWRVLEFIGMKLIRLGAWLSGVKLKQSDEK